MLQHLDAPVVQAGLVDLDGSFIFMLGLFLVFFGILHVVIIKPMMKAHEQRYSRMEGARQDAEAMDLKAAEAATGYEDKLDAARQESVKLRDALRDEGEVETRQRLAATRQQAADQMAEAAAKRAAVLNSAETELEARASELADVIVTRLVGKAGV